ncbi:MAG: DNA photolyase, partial [Thermodesulfobacteriota bacterium]
MSISRLYLLHDAQDARIIPEIEKNLNLKARVIHSPDAVFKEILSAPDPIEEGKKTLILLSNRGSFVKKCPGTREYQCCGYTILHIGTFCIMDCSYCILQSYFHPPVLQFFVNHEDMKKELAKRFESGN